jgi:hypothetical protein
MTPSNALHLRLPSRKIEAPPVSKRIYQYVNLFRSSEFLNKPFTLYFVLDVTRPISQSQKGLIKCGCQESESHLETHPNLLSLSPLYMQTLQHQKHPKK